VKFPHPHLCAQSRFWLPAENIQRFLLVNDAPNLPELHTWVLLAYIREKFPDVQVTSSYKALLNELPTLTPTGSNIRIMIVFNDIPRDVRLVDIAQRESSRCSRFSITLLQIGDNADARKCGTLLVDVWPAWFEFVSF
jgi:hypothetical protein